MYVPKYMEYEKRKKQAAKYTSKSATQSLQEKLHKEQQVRLEVGMNKTSCLLVARYTSSDLADPSALFCGSPETQERAARLEKASSDVRQAAIKGNAQLLKSLLKGQRQQGGHAVDITLPNTGSARRNALHEAAARGHEGVMNALLELQFARQLLASRAGDSRTALHFAAWAGHQGCMRKLLDKISQGDSRSLALAQQDASGWTPLFYADAVMAKLLLEKGATGHAADRGQMSPLHHAARAGDVPLMKVLLPESTAYLNRNAGSGNNGDTPLHLACRHGHLDVVRLLLAQEKVVLNTRNFDYSRSDKHQRRKFDTGATPLHVAAQRDNVAVVEALLKAGANPIINLNDDERQQNQWPEDQGTSGRCKRLIKEARYRKQGRPLPPSMGGAAHNQELSDSEDEQVDRDALHEQLTDARGARGARRGGTAGAGGSGDEPAVKRARTEPDVICLSDSD